MLSNISTSSWSTWQRALINSSGPFCRCCRKERQENRTILSNVLFSPNLVLKSSIQITHDKEFTIARCVPFWEKDILYLLLLSNSYITVVWNASWSNILGAWTVNSWTPWITRHSRVWRQAKLGIEILYCSLETNKRIGSLNELQHILCWTIIYTSIHQQHEEFDKNDHDPIITNSRCLSWSLIFWQYSGTIEVQSAVFVIR